MADIVSPSWLLILLILMLMMLLLQIMSITEHPYAEAARCASAETEWNWHCFWVPGDIVRASLSLVPLSPLFSVYLCLSVCLCLQCLYERVSHKYTLAVYLSLGKLDWEDGWTNG